MTKNGVHLFGLFHKWQERIRGILQKRLSLLFLNCGHTRTHIHPVITNIVLKAFGDKYVSREWGNSFTNNDIELFTHNKYLAENNYIFMILKF
jgi:hypothetical protein